MLSSSWVTWWWCCCGLVALATLDNNRDKRIGSPDILFKFDSIDCESEMPFPSTGTADGYSLTKNAGASCPDSHGVSLIMDDGDGNGALGSLTSNKDMSVFLGARADSGVLTVEFWLRRRGPQHQQAVHMSTILRIGTGGRSSNRFCTSHDLLISTIAHDTESRDISLLPYSINANPPASGSRQTCDSVDDDDHLDHALLGKDQLYHVVLAFTNTAVEVFVNGKNTRHGLSPKGSAAFSTLAFRDNFNFHIGNPEALSNPGAFTSDHSWSGTIHLFAMYNKALTTDEVEMNYAAYLPDSMPVVRDVSFTVIEDELTPIQFSVGEDGGSFFDFDDEHRPTHDDDIGERFTVEDKDSARSELCINSLPTKGTLWVDGTELTAENTQFPYPIGTTLESSHKKVEYLTAKDGNNNIDGMYDTFTLCARPSGSHACTSSTNSEGEEETDTSTVTISVTAVNDPPTVAADVEGEVFAQEPLVITLGAHDVEDDLDDDAHVGVMITRLPEKTVPDGESAGKLYEVSSTGTGCDTSREVELEKKLDSLQVCYFYGSGDGAGGVVAEVEFEYRAIDSEGATSKGSEDGVVTVKVKNQLEPTPVEQWAFEDGIIPEDPALRPTSDFVDPSKQPVVEGMNLLQLKGEDRSSEDRAFKYFISSLPSHGKLFDVTVATSVGGDTKSDLKEHEISVDDFVGDSDKPGFLLSSEEGYVYYQPDLNYFNRRLYMLDSELTEKELGMAPDTFDFGLLIQDEDVDRKITSISGTATHSVRVSNVHDPAIVTVAAGMKKQEGVVLVDLDLAEAWVTVTTVDELGPEQAAEQGITEDSWDTYRLRIECGKEIKIDISINSTQLLDTAFCDLTDGHDDVQKVCLEAPLRVIRLALDTVVFRSDFAVTSDTCTVSVVAVEPECGSTAAAVCLELAAGDGASDTIDITFLNGLSSESAESASIPPLAYLGIAISFAIVVGLCARKWCPCVLCCCFTARQKKPTNKQRGSSTASLPTNKLHDPDHEKEDATCSCCGCVSRALALVEVLLNGQQLQDDEEKNKLPVVDKTTGGHRGGGGNRASSRSDSIHSLPPRTILLVPRPPPRYPPHTTTSTTAGMMSSSGESASLSFAENARLTFVGQPPSHEDHQRMAESGRSASSSGSCRWNEDENSSSRRKEEMQRWARSSGSVNEGEACSTSAACEGIKKKPRSFRPLTMPPPPLICAEEEYRC